MVPSRHACPNCRTSTSHPNLCGQLYRVHCRGDPFFEEGIYPECDVETSRYRHHHPHHRHLPSPQSADFYRLPAAAHLLVRPSKQRPVLLWFHAVVLLGHYPGRSLLDERYAQPHHIHPPDQTLSDLDHEKLGRNFPEDILARSEKLQQRFTSPQCR